MVISDVNQITYNGNGSQTAWPFTFEFIDATDIKLQLIDADGARHDITSDYYVDTVNKTVYYPGYAPGSEPPEEEQPPKVQTGQKIRVYRKLPVNQLANLGDKWPFYVIEKGLDKLTMLIQDVWGWISSNIMQLSDSEFTWDAKGYRIKNVGGPVNVADAATKDYVDKILSGIIASGDGRVVPFDNVAQMREGELVAAQIATTLGYYSINDGGAGVYSIRAKLPTDVDNGGTIIILDNGNVAELLVDEAVNVKQLGAKADGVTDDGNAFAVAISLGKDIVVPTGNYYLAEPVFYNGKVDDNGTYTEYGFMHLTDKVLLKDIRNLQEEFTVTYDTNYFQQGSTYNTKTGKIILGIIKTDNSAQKLLVVDPDTYAIDNTYDYTTLGHCNSLTYCPVNNKIYIPTLLNNEVAVIDGDTMAVVDTIDLGYNPAFLSYDLKNRIFVAVRGYSSGFVKAEFYDEDFTHLKTETYPAPFSYMINNGGCAYDGQLVILSISGYTLCDYFGNVLNFIKITRNTNGLLGNLEAEDCYIVDGVCYTAYIGAYGSSTMVYKHNLMGEVGNLDNRATYYKASDIDLDTLTQPGKYYVLTSNIGTNNFPPTSLGGFMDVFVLNGTEDNPTMCKQVFYQIGSYNFRVYIRDRASGTWSAWKNVTPYGKIKNGRETASIVNAGETGSYSVTFAQPFSENIPSVFCQLISQTEDAALADAGIGVHGASKTGFSVKIWNNMPDSMTPIFYWTAIDIGDEVV